MEKKFTVRDIVIIGMLAALCIIATSLKIPYGNGAMVHLGTAAIFTSAILFGGIKAGLGAAIGSAFFDMLMAFSPYTLWSFVIKGVAGWIAGTISHGGGAQGKSFLRNIIACLAAALWTLIGYMAAWTAVSGQFAIAVTNIPSSLMTSAVGLIIGLPLATAIKNSAKNYNF